MNTEYWGAAGEKAVEALASYERSTISMFKAAASKLIKEVGSPEDAVAMALAKITGLSTLKVNPDAISVHHELPWYSDMRFAGNSMVP